MQHLLSFGLVHQQKTQHKQIQTSVNPTVQKHLMDMYETRLKSLMQTIKVYQEALVSDNENGALAFMKTEEMAAYRVDREYELLKDVLLTEKEKLVIKVLTSFHQIRKESQILKHQLQVQMQKGPFVSKNYSQNVAQKDFTSKVSIEKQSRFSMRNNNNSRVSIASHQQPNYQPPTSTSTSISVYQKLLQEKLSMIKDLQKKNKQLIMENEESLRKVSELTMHLDAKVKEQTLKRQEECTECKKMNDVCEKMKVDSEVLKMESEKLKLKLREEEFVNSSRSQEIKLKDLKLTQLSLKLQTIQKQHDLLLLQVQQKSKQTKSTLPSTNNLQTINQLKEKLLTQQQQLMSITNSFEFLKEEISESLASEIRRLKNSHALLRDNLIKWVMTMKREMVQNMVEIIETVKMKCEKKNYNQDFGKKLRQIDNELDFFLEQKHIRL